MERKKERGGLKRRGKGIERRRDREKGKGLNGHEAINHKLRISFNHYANDLECFRLFFIENISKAIYN